MTTPLAGQLHCLACLSAGRLLQRAVQLPHPRRKRIRPRVVLVGCSGRVCEQRLLREGG